MTTETLPVRLLVLDALDAFRDRPPPHAPDGSKPHPHPAAKRSTPAGAGAHERSRPTAAGAGIAGFQPKRLQFSGALSELFRLDLEGFVENTDLDLEALAGAPVAVELFEQALLPVIWGIVTEARQHSAVQVGVSRFTLRVGPPLWLTTLRRDCRIFQNLSVPDIAAAVVAGADYGERIAPPALRLTRSHVPREYCVQYDETDWEFLARVLADDGIAMFFDQSNEGAWTLVDDTDASPLDLGVTVPFRDLSNMAPMAEQAGAVPHVTRVGATRSPRAVVAALRDYDFMKPAYPLQGFAVAEAPPFPHETPIGVFDVGVGKFADDGAGVQRATARLDAARVGRRGVTCEGNFFAVIGGLLTLDGCPRADANGAQVVTRVAVALEAGGSATYTFDACPRQDRFLPSPQPKPRVFGTQTAIVVGPPGEEIAVDELGRVQVEFRWDRRDTHTANASRWVRVSRPWAGNMFGISAVPRVGDEVVISYLDGDPDQPLVVGCVHNAARISPLAYPAEATQSVWRSQSTPGGAGFNEIRMEDKAGAEILSITAQRDRIEKVGRHVQSTIVGNQSGQVGGNSGGQIAGNASEEIGGDMSLSVAGSASVDVSGDASVTVGGSASIGVSGDLGLTVGGGERESIGGDKGVGVGGSYSVGVGGPYTLNAPQVAITGTSMVHVTTGSERLDESAMHLLRTKLLIVQAPTTEIIGTFVQITSDVIVLNAGGSTITLGKSGIIISSPGPVSVQGNPIELNC